MWDCHWWRSLLPNALTLQKPPNQSLLLLLPPTHHQNDAVSLNCISFAGLARMLTSWLNRRRRCRYLLLILCSPFLVPLFLAICPLICAVEVCLLMCRRRKAAEGGEGRGESAEGGDEVGLLQRYLEDQLILVIESAYDCGDGGGKVVEEYGADVQYFGSARALLQ